MLASTGSLGDVRLVGSIVHGRTTRRNLLQDWLSFEKKMKRDKLRYQGRMEKAQVGVITM